MLFVMRFKHLLLWFCIVKHFNDGTTDENLISVKEFFSVFSCLQRMKWCQFWRIFAPIISIHLILIPRFVAFIPLWIHLIVASLSRLTVWIEWEREKGAASEAIVKCKSEINRFYFERKFTVGFLSSVQLDIFISVTVEDAFEWSRSSLSMIIKCSCWQT